MHILQIIHGYPLIYNAGSEVYTQSICNELSKSHKVSVLTREENPYAPDFSIRKEIANDNLTIYLLNNPNGKDGYRHKEMDDVFSELLNELKPDIAHIGHLNHLSTGFVDVLNSRRTPIIFTLHDFWLMCPRGQFLTRSIGKENNYQVCEKQINRKCATDCYQVYFSGREENREHEINVWSLWIDNRMKETKAIVDKVDLFIAPSQYLRTRFITDFEIPEHKIQYLDYGFPTHYLTPTEKPHANEIFTFGYIGTHIPSKGVNLLIEAFSKLQEKSRLIIFGRENGQSTRALTQLAAQQSNEIIFGGEYINHNLANDVFSKVDCIIVPSIWSENSPLVIHEAQACRVPVITADCGGMKEYVHHNVNGLLFKHRDVESLSEQLKFAINNPKTMKSLGERGYINSSTGDVDAIEDHCKELEKIYSAQLPDSLWRITIDTNPEDCNLHCIMCEEHSPFSRFKETLYAETGVRHRRMPIFTVEDIFKQVKALGIKEIIPSTMGEPLLYKGIERMYELSSEFNIKLNLTTNGTFPIFPIERWAEIIIPNTTDIKISWNGATAKTSESIMNGQNFDKTIEKVKALIAYRDQHYQTSGYYCRITFQLTFLRSNMQELADIVKLAAQLGVDRVKGHHLWAHFEEIKHLSMKSTVGRIKEWNTYVEEARDAQNSHRRSNGEKVILENIIPLNLEEQIEVPESYNCPFLTKELWVSATGNVSPCCAPDNLRKSLGDFGNINKRTISEIIHSEEYRYLVRNYKKIPLCKTCNMRKPQ
ncbi:MAG: glycosyltransferase [Bacteroidales bacterium]